MRREHEVRAQRQVSQTWLALTASAGPASKLPRTAIIKNMGTFGAAALGPR